MSKYYIFAIFMSNLVELGPIFHSLLHKLPVRLILSGVLKPKGLIEVNKETKDIFRRTLVLPILIFGNFKWLPKKVLI